MTDDEFWQVIARAKGKAKVARAMKLRTLFEAMDASEVLEFERAYLRLFVQAYTNELWGAMVVVFGGCSDDGFMDARAGLIALGESVFRAALRDPDSLAKLSDPEELLLEGSKISFVAQEVYRAKTNGVFSPLWPEVPDLPQGLIPDDDDLPELYPKLWARFGDEY